VENISRFILNRSAAHIKRYHTTPMFAQESVAEHSHFVAMITRIICHTLETSGQPVDTLRAVDLAMIHDYEEAISGDIISTFKHSHPEFIDLLDRLTDEAIDQVFEGLPPELGAYYTELWRGHSAGSLEGQIVSVADKLAGLAFSYEQLHMGNQFMEPVYRRFVWLVATIPFPWWLVVRERVAAGLVEGMAEPAADWPTTWRLDEEPAAANGPRPALKPV
jgi:5'-deoxynucleotidase YfbR-like HD superfamily hydrolase